jgi:hypothetical protein
MFEVQPIQPAHQDQLGGVKRRRHVVHGAPADSDQLSLAFDR